MPIIELDLERHFYFLTTSYEFIKIPEYTIVREIYNDYQKNNLVVKLIYAGSLLVNIRTLNDGIKSFYTERNRNKIINLQTKLGANELMNLFDTQGNFELQAELIADLLKDNPSLLNGDLWQLTPWYRFGKWFNSW